MPTIPSELNTALKENDLLENYFRNTIIPQLFVDGQMRLQKFTPPAMKQFDLKNEHLGKHIEEVKENFRFPSIIENINQVIENNEILEKEIQTTDLRWYQMNIIPYVEIVSNKTNGVIITFVEITARIKDLKEQEKLIADYEILIDTISHDIKTPITNLILSIEMFKRATNDNNSEFQSLLKIVDNSIRKMKNIVEELTSKRKEEHFENTEGELLNIEHILEDVKLTLTDKIRESTADVKTVIKVSEITFVRRKMRSILYNLLNNAIKFACKDCNPEILVTTEKEDDFTVISVKDNGIGIEADKHEEIFKKYFRAENSTEGSGIGLYLVKQIVINAGGKVTLISEPGKGSEFKVYLKG